MSKLAGMTPRNVKENCQRLLQKLALEKVQAHRSEERIGATYRVYSYAIILQRRRTAGLEWITRNRGGVTFVSPPENDSRDTVSPKPRTRDTVASQDTGTVSSQGTVSLELQSAISPKKQATSDEKQTRDTVASQDTPLDNKTDIEERQSSSGFSTIHEIARKWSVVLDDDAVRKLIRRCHDEDPAATEDEIAAFLNVKILQLRNSPTRNMVGMLLSAVPAYFVKPATELAKYRQQKAEERAKHLQIAREILADPESSLQDRQWAQDLISSSTTEQVIAPAETSTPIDQLAALLARWFVLDYDAVQTIWNICRQGTPDCTPEEIAEFARKCHKGENSESLIRMLPTWFDNGGGVNLKGIREKLAAAARRRREAADTRR
jgi:hypothetical protein